MENYIPLEDLRKSTMRRAILGLRAIFVLLRRLAIRSNGNGSTTNSTVLMQISTFISAAQDFYSRWRSWKFVSSTQVDQKPHQRCVADCLSNQMDVSQVCRKQSVTYSNELHIEQRSSAHSIPFYLHVHSKDRGANSPEGRGARKIQF